MMKLCPKCNNLTHYDYYFGAYICPNCYYRDYSDSLRFPQESDMQLQLYINPNITEQQLIDFGFTNYDPQDWYYSRRLSYNITFNIIIPKFKPSAFIIRLLDEDFLQPYIGNNKKIMLEYLNVIRELVEADILVIR